MNKRKPVDFSELHRTLDKLMLQKLSETELYYEVGRAVGVRSERCAAVMVSEYLRERYPEKSGFSPRNVRRMRDFYRAYENDPVLLNLALQIKWTLNLIILENCGSAEERDWYLRQVHLRKWKKSELVNAIKSQAWLQAPLDLQTNICYTEKKEATQETERNEKDSFRVPWKYLPQPNGRVRDEGPGEESRSGISIPHRIRSNQSGGDRQSGLPTGTPQAGGARQLTNGDYDTCGSILGCT